MSQPCLSGLPIFVLEQLLKQCTLTSLFELSRCNRALNSVIRTLRYSPPTIDVLVKDYQTVVSVEKSLWILQNRKNFGNYPSFNPVVDLKLGEFQVSMIRDDFYNEPLYQVFYDCHIELTAQFLSHLKELFPRTLKFNFKFEKLSEEVSSKVLEFLPLTDAETLEMDDLQLSEMELRKVLGVLNVKTFKKDWSSLTNGDVNGVIEKFCRKECEKLCYLSIGVRGLARFPILAHPDRPQFFVTPEGERIDCTGGFDGARDDGTVYTVLLTPNRSSQLFQFMVWPREVVQGPVERD